MLARVPYQEIYARGQVIDIQRLVADRFGNEIPDALAPTTSVPNGQQLGDGRWRYDADGRYDNAGFTLRGRISSDDEGAFIIDTILPGSYPDRPQRHIHVKVRRPDDSDLLTTQIYFSDDPNLGCHSTGPRISLVDGYGTLDFIVPA